METTKIVETEFPPHGSQTVEVPAQQKITTPFRRVTTTLLQIPDFKWKTRGKFNPSQHYFDSSKVNISNLLHYYDDIIMYLSICDH